MFIDEDRDTFLRHRSTTSIIGHELMHQWFGNLVTCDWWDEIYVNEAFGSIGGYLGLSMTSSEAQYQWEDEYMCSQTFSGMVTDSRNNSRPMVNRMNNDMKNTNNYPVDTPSRISRQFDNIAYNKAGSVMLMIRALIGDELWTKGLSDYLNTRSYQTAKWDQLLSFWDKVITQESNEELLNLNGQTITEIFEPYFTQMGVPALIITLQGNSLNIKTDRFLSREVEDKAWPLSSLEYKWNIPLVVQYPTGRKIYWLLNAGLTDEEFQVDLEDPDFIIDPDANIWCRINFDQEYVNKMVENKDNLSARHITKVMQDQYQMLTSDYKVQYNGDITSVLSLTKTMIDNADYTKWLLWREVDINNFFDNLHTTLVPFLESVGESDMLNLYKTYMTSTTKAMFNEVYPDKSNTVAYDITKARITPYIVRLMLKYADDDIEVTQKYHDTAQLTVTDELPFLKQSPDTRPETFKGAVIHESKILGPTSYKTTTNYLVSYINQQLANGVQSRDVISCRSKDTASGVNVPLYSGDCIENTYFNALASASPDGWSYILDSVNSQLRSELAVRFAQSVSGKSSLFSLVPYVSESDKSRLLAAACNGMSTSGHQIMIEQLAEMLGGELDSNVNECMDRMIYNQDLLDAHLTDLTTFLCEQSDSPACQPLIKCPSPARFAFNEWRLPASYKPEKYAVHLNLDGLKEEDKIDGFFHYQGESSVDLKINEDSICHITLHVQEDPELMYNIKHQLHVNG